MNCFLCQLFYCNSLSPLVSICCCSSDPNLCHRLGGNCHHWLDPWQKVVISCLLPLLDRIHHYCLLLLIWFPFMVPEPSSCDLRMHTTQAGSVATKILLFHSYNSCAGTVIGPCTYNHTIYLVCSHGNQYICFSSTYCPWEQWLEIRIVTTLGPS
jgi:hypothetical protein